MNKRMELLQSLESEADVPSVIINAFLDAIMDCINILVSRYMYTLRIVLTVNIIFRPLRIYKSFFLARSVRRVLEE